MIPAGNILASLRQRIAFQFKKVMVILVAKTAFDQQLGQFFAQFDARRSVILTPNKRLSRFFIDQYAAKQTSNAFVSLPCLAVNVWIHQLWQELEFIDDHPLANCSLLSSFQENLLWEKILTQHPDTPPLINTRATAKQAQSAWRLMHDWQLEPQELIAAAKLLDDPFIFRSWYQEFERICQQKQYLSVAQVPGLLTKRLAALLNSHNGVPGQLAALREQAGALGLLARRLPEHIYLYGFDELIPANQQLLAELEQCGVRVSTLELKVAHTVVQRCEYATAEQELLAVTRWAMEKIAAQPDIVLGVVVPDLPAQRSKIERVFMQAFEPQYIFPQQPQHSTGFNISTGEPIAQVPVIATALTALSCHAEYLELPPLSLLLRSPFVGQCEELSLRTLWDGHLHQLGEFELSFQKFKSLISELSAKVNPSTINNPHETTDPAAITAQTADFYQRLIQFDVLRKAHKKKQHYPSQWCAIFIEQLKAWGWPGNRQLDTLEYQQVQNFYVALEEFAGLDFLLGRVDQTQALEVLTTALKQTPFHAQTRQSPLQILGLLEAAGLAFDELWVLGLDDDTWPPAAKPNPLLPLKIQRELNLPQSSPEREFHFAQQLIQRLTQCSLHLTASSVASKGDKKLSASPLISHFPLREVPSLEVNSYQQDLFASRKLSSSLDFCGPRIVDLESIRGGSQILKSQATCPFQAFARYRLHTSEISVPTLGLNALERGNLVHKIMEIIWRVLQDQAQLLALNDDALMALITQASTQALMDIRQKQVAGPQFLHIEAQRLGKQVFKWLQLEKQRAPFTVLFNEGRKTLKLEKMPIQIRYDRVDELSDGSLFVLDYKTGTNALNDWAGVRPNEPQVPLYAIANAKRVAGAAFGQISADTIGFNGVGEDNAIAPGLSAADKLPKIDLPATWQAILQHWEIVLARLAREFLAGFAAVDPKHPPTSCRYCELHALCRIREQFDFDAPNAQEEEITAHGEYADAN